MVRRCSALGGNARRRGVNFVVIDIGHFPPLLPALRFTLAAFPAVCW